MLSPIRRHWKAILLGACCLIGVVLFIRFIYGLERDRIDNETRRTQSLIRIADALENRCPKCNP